MKLAIGSDHAGFALKEELKQVVRDAGHEVLDVGTHSTEPCDYPDFAAAAAEAVAGGQAERGLVLCGSGVGASIVANKVRGIRASVCHDTYSAHQGVEHDDMNVLVVGARVIGSEPAKEILRAFLGARFSNEERHRRRLGKLLAVEDRYFR